MLTLRNRSRGRDSLQCIKIPLAFTKRFASRQQWKRGFAIMYGESKKDRSFAETSDMTLLTRSPKHIRERLESMGIALSLRTGLARVWPVGMVADRKERSESTLCKIKRMGCAISRHWCPRCLPRSWLCSFKRALPEGGDLGVTDKVIPEIDAINFPLGQPPACLSFAGFPVASFSNASEVSKGKALLIELVKRGLVFLPYPGGRHDRA